MRVTSEAVAFESIYSRNVSCVLNLISTFYRLSLEKYGEFRNGDKKNEKYRTGTMNKLGES